MNIEELIELRIKAKNAEDAAAEERKRIDKIIAEQLKDRDEGTVTTDAGKYKVSVTYKLDRKVDSDAVTKAWDTLGSTTQSAFRWKAELETKVFRAIEILGGTELAELSKYVTTKPGSPTLKIELKGN